MSDKAIRISFLMPNGFHDFISIATNEENLDFQSLVVVNEIKNCIFSHKWFADDTSSTYTEIRLDFCLKF